MSNLVEILVTAKNLSGPALASVNAQVEKTSGAMKVLNKTAGLAALGFAAVGVEAVKMAGKFDSEMTLLQTQAGVSKDKIAGLKKGVLDLAGQVAQSPDSLAESLFHVESNFESMGITSKKALEMVKISAEGATVGHANLVDVTNALTAAVASGIPGVQNMSQAMGVLNATVGIGDMKMSDLASAFGTGMVATVKGYGLSISDVAAGLAVFGDNNIRGAKAGNQLRMSVQALATPAAGGAAALRSIGLQTDSLAKDMQKGGLKLALDDLVAHMQAAGMTSKEQGALITEAFGKKAGTGLNILVDQLGRLESKYPALAAGAKGFGDSWAATQKTFAFQLKSLQSSFDALMIGIGEKLIPPVQAFVHVLAQNKSAVMDVTLALGGLLAAMITVSTAMKVAAAWKAFSDGLVLMSAKLGVMSRASVAAGGGLRGLGAAFGTLSTGAKLGVTIAAIGALVLVLNKLGSSGKKAPDVDRMSTALGKLGDSGKASGELTKTFGDNLNGLAADLDKLAGKKDALDHFNDTMNAIFTLGMKGSNGPRQAAKDVDAVDKGLAELVTSGHADQAAAALAKLQKQTGKSFSPKDLDDYNAALQGTALQAQLTAATQGKFGQEALKVQADLQVQQAAVDGLTQSLQALDQVNQDAYNSDTKFEDAISKATSAVKENGRTLDIHTDKGRANRDILSGLAAATDDYTAKLAKQTGGWDAADAAYKRGYDGLVKSAMAMGDSRSQAEKLANSLLHVPKEVKVQGNIEDLESKLRQAKKDLASAPASKKAKIQGDITQLEAQIRKAKAQLASITGKTVRVNVVTTHTSSGSVAHEGGNYASGGHVIGPGSGTSDDVPIWASNGEFVVSAAAAKRNRKLLEAINGGMAGFASGGSVSASERQARNSALGDLSLSFFGSKVYSRNEFQSSTASPASLGDLVGTLNQWRATIKAATHGAQESKLIAAFDKFGVAALKNEKALTAVNSKLDSAKDKLSSLKDSFNQLKDSVASSVVSFGSIAKGATGQPGGSGMVVAQLKNDVASAQQFAQALETLRKKGLNGQSLSELAQAGISGGGLENAERLLSGSSGDIKTINALEKQLQAAGAAAGTSAGTGLYGGQINAAQALVTGLQKQQSKLDAVMEHAADAMAKQFKRALSGKASGGTVGAAATGGNRWGATWVGEHGRELLDLPVGSRVHSNPDSERMAAAGRGGWGGRPIELTLNLGGQRVAKVLIDPLREEIRELGGDVQKVLGRR